MESSKHFHTLYILALMAIAVSVFSCDNPRIFDDYEAIAQDGWERNKVLTFNVPKMQHTGTYQQWVQLRAYQKYPFQTVTLIVEQTVFPQKQVYRDTIDCHIINKEGRLEGKNGISCTEVVAHLRTLQLQQGDSLTISIRHDMRRELLPGISDVGIRIEEGVRSKE